MQNLAIKNAEQGFVRELFVPTTEGNLFLSADYSNIDLRVLAHLSGDGMFVKAFHNQEDVHRLTALGLFHKTAASAITKEERYQAKVLNFSLLYGVTPFGIKEALNVTFDEAKNLINKYYESHHAISEFKQSLLAHAFHNHYVKTINGRRRYIDNLSSKNKIVKEAAIRMAVNMPIQGLSADIIKIAMVKIDDCLVKQNLKSQLILQIHDELILEVEPQELEAVSELVKNAMIHAMKLAVPLDVHLSAGNNLLDLKG